MAAVPPPPPAAAGWQAPPSPPPPGWQAPETAPPPKPKGGWSKWKIAGVAIVALLVIGTIGNLAKSPEATPAPSTGAQATSGPTSTPAPGTTETPQPTDTVAPTDTPIPTDTPAPTFAAKSFKGRGDRVVKFIIPQDQAAIARIANSGGENFVVESLDASGATNDLLVNTIGAYRGTVLFDSQSGTHSVAFKITSTASWTVTVAPLSAARSWDGASALKGSGDDVVLVSPPIAGLFTANVTNSGVENFVVQAYTADSSDLVVNEIGKFSGQEQLPDGTLLLSVESTGSWSISPS